MCGAGVVQGDHVVGDRGRTCLLQKRHALPNAPLFAAGDGVENDAIHRLCTPPETHSLVVCEATTMKGAFFLPYREAFQDSSNDPKAV